MRQRRKLVYRREGREIEFFSSTASVVPFYRSEFVISMLQRLSQLVFSVSHTLLEVVGDTYGTIS